MNVWLDTSSAINHYYDGDFPGQDHCRYPENFDETTAFQGLRHDVPRYVEIAGRIAGPLLELCCGTGRVALPLAAAGHEVVGVDFSRELLQQFRAKLAAESDDLARRIEIVEQDITLLSLPRRDYPLAIVAFNSLLCLPEFEMQCRALDSIASHLAGDGLLLLDLVNPLQLPILGDPVPKPFFTRRNPHTGRAYTRFAMLGPFDETQRQELHGWYDEIEDNGRVSRRRYSLSWRPIFRYEIELMLDRAGLAIDRIEGGHRGERYTATSPRMFIHARKQRG
jgi:SAM-dependent methyltransferase